MFFCLNQKCVSHVKLPLSLGRDLNSSTIELRLWLHRRLSFAPPFCWRLPCGGLTEVFLRCAIFFGSFFFPKPQNWGGLLDGDACFCATYGKMCLWKCAKIFFKTIFKKQILKPIVDRNDFMHEETFASAGSLWCLQNRAYRNSFVRYCICWTNP